MPWAPAINCRRGGTGGRSQRCSRCLLKRPCHCTSHRLHQLSHPFVHDRCSHIAAASCATPCKPPCDSRSRSLSEDTKAHMHEHQLALLQHTPLPSLPQLARSLLPVPTQNTLTQPFACPTHTSLHKLWLPHHRPSGSSHCWILSLSVCQPPPSLSHSWASFAPPAWNCTTTTASLQTPSASNQKKTHNTETLAGLLSLSV